MRSPWVLPAAIATTLVVGCAYEFGGAGGAHEGASSVDTGPTVGQGDASSVVGSTAAPSSGDAQATTTTVVSGSVSSSSSGMVAMNPCYADDFSSFDTNDWQGSLDAQGSGASADAVAEGPSDGAFRTLAGPVGECFVSVSFDPDPGGRIYLDLRQDAKRVFGVGLDADGEVGLFLDDEGVTTAGPVVGVDAVALYLGATEVTAYYRGPQGWTALGVTPRPSWLDDGSPQITGFGLVGSLGVTVHFHDFSLAAPPVP